MGLGIAIRVVVFTTLPTIEMDGVVYAIMGSNFAKGNFAEALEGVFPPFYPLIIGFFHLFIPDIELAGRCVSLFSSILLIYVFFVFMERYLRSGEKKVCYEESVLYSVLFIAIHPYLIRYAPQVLSESSATLLFTLAVFFFFNGWINNRLDHILFSSVFLAFTYLTRPEYIAYLVPLVIVLVARKRFFHAALFLFCFAIIALPYISYLRLETGIWIISKKALLMRTAVKDAHDSALYLIPGPSIIQFLKNIPSVFYYFLEAVSPLFVLLCLFGMRSVDKQYRLLMAVLIATHVMTIALVGPSIRRFSVPFIPLMMVFAAQGGNKFSVYLRGLKHTRALTGIAFIVLLALCLYMGITLPDRGRMLEKEAGRWMLKYDPEQRIASRLPLVGFYSEGEWVNLTTELQDAKTCAGLTESLRGKRVQYLSVDDKMVEEFPGLLDCLPTTAFSYVWGINNEEGSVRIYRLKHE